MRKTCAHRLKVAGEQPPRLKPPNTNRVAVQIRHSMNRTPLRHQTPSAAKTDLSFPSMMSRSSLFSLQDFPAPEGTIVVPKPVPIARLLGQLPGCAASAAFPPSSGIFRTSDRVRVRCSAIGLLRDLLHAPIQPFPCRLVRGCRKRLRVSVPPWLHFLWLRLCRAVCLRAFVVNQFLLSG